MLSFTVSLYIFAHVVFSIKAITTTTIIIIIIIKIM